MEKKHIILGAILINSFIVYKAACLQHFTSLIDLTWHFENNTIYWQGVQPFVFTKILAGIMNNKFWLAMNEFCAGEHGGTHMDAPYHFNQKGIKIGQIPLQNLIVPGVLIDISTEVEEGGANTTLTEEHIKKWEHIHGPIPNNSLVLIKFGWSQYYPDKSKYLGPDNSKGTLRFPGLSTEAAQYFVDNTNIVGVGVDVASLDPGFSTTFEVHQILNGHGLYLLENVKLIEKLPAREFTLIAFPMNIAEGTGAPLRLVAIPKGYI